MASLFKFAIKSHGRIDHVFANAGISPRATYFEDNTDADGDPLPPDFRTIDINLKGVINTVSLAMHYLRKQERGGSIVLTASASAYQRYSAGDYSRISLLLRQTAELMFETQPRRSMESSE